MFYISYSIFEVPSNYCLKVFGPSVRTSAPLPSQAFKAVIFIFVHILIHCFVEMDCVVTIRLGSYHHRFEWCDQLCHSRSHTLAPGNLRGRYSLIITPHKAAFMLTYSGMYPGLVFYLTFWYRPEERSLRIAIFLSCASLAGAFGGSIAYGVGNMNGTAGLVGWRWLFILEGIPSCLFAFVVLFLLPDYPESATWLNAEEKALAVERMRSVGSKGKDKAMTWVEAKSTLTDWRLYAHYLVGSAPMTIRGSLRLTN